MPTELGRLLVRLGLDGTEFDKELQSAERRLRQTGRQLQSVGRGLSIGVTAPLAAASAAAIKTAADYEELSSLIDVTFAGAADSVRAWAATTADATNRSSASLLKAAGDFAAFLKPLGVAPAAATSMSKALSQLAVDVGSFRNLADEEVFTRLFSGLAGETEAVRRLGVDIGQAAIKTELLRLGYKGIASDAPQALKVQARYNLILAQTTDAQGDAVRTAESLTNQFRGLQGDIEDVSIAFGTEMIPAAKAAVTQLREIVGAIEDLDPETRRLAIAAGGAAAAMGPLALGIGSVSLVIGALGGPLTAMIAGLSAIAGIAIAQKISDEAEEIRILGLSAKDAADELERLNAARNSGGLAGLSGQSSNQTGLAAFGNAGDPGRERRRALLDEQRFRAEFLAFNEEAADLAELLGFTASAADAASVDLDAYANSLAGATDASKEAAKATEKIADTFQDLNDELLKEAIGDFSADLAVGTREIRALGVEAGKSAAAIEADVAAFVALKTAIRDVTQERERQAEAIADSNETSRLARQFAVDQREAAREAAEQSAEAFQKPFENAFENIQRAWGDTLTELVRDGIDSFEDIEDALKDIGARLVGELGELALTRFTGIDKLFGQGGGVVGGGALIPETGLGADASLDQVLAALRGGVAEGAEEGTSSGLESVLRGITGGGGNAGGGGGFDLLSLFGGGAATTGGGLLGAASPALAFGLAKRLGIGGPGLGSTLVGAGLAAATTPLALASIGGLAGGIGGAIGLGTTAAGGASAVLGGTLATAGALSSTGIGAILAAILVAAGGAYGSSQLVRGIQGSGFRQNLGSVSPEEAARTAGFTTLDPITTIVAAILANNTNLPRAFFGFETRAPGSGSGPLGFAAESPFGTLVQTAQRGPAFAPLLESIASLDRAIAETLNPEEIAAVAVRLSENTALQGFGERRPSAIAFGASQVIAARVGAIFEELEGSGFANQFGARAQFAGTADQLSPIISEFLEVRGKFQATIRALSGEEIPRLELSLSEVRGAAAEARAEFGALGLDISRIDTAEVAGIQERLSDFDEALDLALADPLTQALAAVAEDTERLIADARIAEAEGVINAIARAEEIGARRRAAAIQQVADPLDNLIQELTGTTRSPLAILDVLGSAESRFGGLLADVQGGDLAQLGDLEGAARNLIDVSREAFGSTAAFFEVFDRVTEGLSSVLSGLPGFATGGSFVVGGSGGTDSQLVAFMATPGERVTVNTSSFGVSTPGAAFFRDGSGADSRELLRETQRMRIQDEGHAYRLERLLASMLGEIGAMRQANERLNRRITELAADQRVAA